MYTDTNCGLSNESYVTLWQQTTKLLDIPASNLKRDHKDFIGSRVYLKLQI